MCKAIKYGQPLGPYLSSYVLMATAIDRHQAICYPLTYCSWTSRRSRIMVWMAWGAALIFCIPQVSNESITFIFKEIFSHTQPPLIIRIVGTGLRET